MFLKSRFAPARPLSWSRTVIAGAVDRLDLGCTALSDRWAMTVRHTGATLHLCVQHAQLSNARPFREMAMRSWTVPVSNGRACVAVPWMFSNPAQFCRPPEPCEGATPTETVMLVCITNIRHGPEPFCEEIGVLWNTAHKGSHKEHLRHLLITGEGTAMFRYIPGSPPAPRYLLSGFMCEPGKPVLKAYALQADRRVCLKCQFARQGGEPWRIALELWVSSLTAPLSELMLKLVTDMELSDCTIHFSLSYFSRGLHPIAASVLDASTPLWKLAMGSLFDDTAQLSHVFAGVRLPGQPPDPFTCPTIEARVVAGKLQLTDPLGELREVADTYSVEDVPSRTLGELQEIMQEVRPHEGQTALHARVCGLAKALDTEAESYAAAHDQLVAYERILRWCGDPFSTETSTAITNAQQLLELATPSAGRGEELCPFVTFPRPLLVFPCPVLSPTI